MQPTTCMQQGRMQHMHFPCVYGVTYIHERIQRLCRDLGLLWGRAHGCMLVLAAPVLVA